MRDLLQRPDLFSINTATLGYKTPLPAIIDACAARGIGAVSYTHLTLPTILRV